MKTTAIILALLATGVFADGIPFEGDRVVGSKTTVLTLTTNQISQLETQSSEWEKQTPDQRGTWKMYGLRTLQLTSEQRRKLEQDAGFAPTNIIVWSLASAKSTCTCEVLNIGIRFEFDKIEVLHWLLGVDIEDRERRIATLRNEQKAKRIPNQPSECTR